MREIRFRGIGIADHKWHEWGVFESPMPVIRETVGQYTGLHDKNGKEIYVGDILRVRLNSELIMTDKVFIKPSGLWCCGDYSVKFISHEAELIGNIHENPELLEESK